MDFAHRRAHGSINFLELPTELQLVCLGFATDASTLATWLASCSALKALQERALELFCKRKWPVLASVAADAIEGGLAPPEFWQTVANTAKMVASASAATSNPAHSFNEHVTAARREILVEWLITVSQDWELDGADVFMAVRILDAFLASRPLTSISLLQLVGICCLRVAMRVRLAPDSVSRGGGRSGGGGGGGGGGGSSCGGASRPRRQKRQQRPRQHKGKELDADAGEAVGGDQTTTAATATATAAPPDELFPAARFADICADTYSVDAVERMTATVSEFVALRLADRSAPLMALTARHFLRGLWVAAVEPPPQPPSPEVAAPAAAAAVVPASARGAVLLLAGFLLHMSLLDPACCAAPPSHAAAAAMSLALEALGLPPWPPALRRALPLRAEQDLGPLRRAIAAAQATRGAPHMRKSWVEELGSRHWRMRPVEMAEGRRWMGADPDSDDESGGGGLAPAAAAAAAAAAAGGAEATMRPGRSGAGGDSLSGGSDAGGGGGSSSSSGSCAGGGCCGGEGSGAVGGAEGAAVAAARARVEGVVKRKGELPVVLG